MELCQAVEPKIRLPKEKKTKHADFEGAKLLAGKLEMLKVPTEVGNELLGTLLKETKILARLAGDNSPGKGESYIPVGMIAGMAEEHRHWVRRPGNFRSRTHNAFQQLHALCAHLFEKYPTAPFLQKGLEPRGGVSYRRVYLHIAKGGNVRTASGFPFDLTKTQAHIFHTLTGDPGIAEGAILAQALGWGVDPRLASRLSRNRWVASSCPTNNKFWQKFFEFLARQNMVDPSQIDPLCDYLNEHRITRDRMGNITGEFCFKGRPLNAILERMEAWHKQLQRVRTSRNRVWEPTLGINSKEIEKRWHIGEILKEKDLLTEGRELNHCVYSYAGRCAEKKTSIWSLRIHDETYADGWKRTATIEVSLDSGRRGEIVQGRGKGNRFLNASELHFVNTWAMENGLKVGRIQ